MMLCHFVQDDCLAAGGDADAYIVRQINTIVRQWPDPYAKSAYTAGSVVRFGAIHV